MHALTECNLCKRFRQMATPQNSEKRSKKSHFGALFFGWGSIADYCYWTEIYFRGNAWKHEATVAMLFVKGKFHYQGAVEFEDAETGEIRTLTGPFFNVMCCNVSHIATDAHLSPRVRDVPQRCTTSPQTPTYHPT